MEGQSPCLSWLTLCSDGAVGGLLVAAVGEEKHDDDDGDQWGYHGATDGNGAAAASALASARLQVFAGLVVDSGLDTHPLGGTAASAAAARAFVVADFVTYHVHAGVHTQHIGHHV